MSIIYKFASWLLYISVFSSAVYGKEVVMFVEASPRGYAPPYYWYDHCEDKPQGVINIASTRLFNDLDLVYKPRKSYLPENLKKNEIPEFFIDLLLSEEIDAFWGTAFFKQYPSLSVSNHPLLKIHYKIFQKSDSKVVTKVKDLENLTGGISVINNNQLARTLKVQGISLVEVGSLDELADLVLEGKLDYGVASSRVMKTLLVEKRLRGKIITSELNLYDRAVNLVVKKGSLLSKKMDEVDILLKEYDEKGYIDFLHGQSILQWDKRNKCN